MIDLSQELKEVPGKAIFIEGVGLVTDFMPSDDLNECVETLLQRKSKAEFKL